MSSLTRPFLNRNVLLHPPVSKQNCHPDRSVAKWRDPLFFSATNQPSLRAPPSPLSSSRAKPRDLQFRGSLLEMFFERSNGIVLPHPSVPNRIVIPRACDFFDLFVFSAHLTGCFFTIRQSRHPERSAAQIYRITDGLWRGVEGPRRCLLADVLPSFPATNYKGNQKSHTSDRSVGTCGFFPPPNSTHLIHVPVAMTGAQ
jgi:hypothetical protein